ncbi:MAG: DNA-directed RNA polymerase subunit N [Candidatus Aenigmarchaeota archaeon]|nr:DNA-directed RNA polymerase subunit N [Candidatus Aenigmarchaeota archaeon]
MMIPIRCMTCGKPVGHLWEAYQKEAKSLGSKEALDKLGLERYCCRALFISHVDLIPRVGQFRK